jgi:hypothetical protein
LISDVSVWNEHDLQELQRRQTMESIFWHRLYGIVTEQKIMQQWEPLEWISFQTINLITGQIPEEKQDIKDNEY